MRWILAGVLTIVATGVAAAPQATAPARRKPASAEFRADVLTQFVEAIIADKAGDLDGALRDYQRAQRMSPHPNTIYNIADLQRRMEKLEDAIESYKKYLELAPRAKDRAEVERLIAHLARTPGVAVIDGKDLGAVIYINGKLVGPSPIVIPLSDGEHWVERIGPTSYGYRTISVKRATTRHSSFSSTDQPGNVILSSTPAGYSGSWTDNGTRYRLPGRLTLAPGRHEIPYFSKDRGCNPIVFDVPAGDVVTYVHVTVGKKIEGPGGCYPIKTRQERVRFP